MLIIVMIVVWENRVGKSFFFTVNIACYFELLHVTLGCM